jgi:hypothetical protein
LPGVPVSVPGSATGSRPSPKTKIVELADGRRRVGAGDLLQARHAFLLGADGKLTPIRPLV